MTANLPVGFYFQQWEQKSGDPVLNVGSCLTKYQLKLAHLFRQLPRTVNNDQKILIPKPLHTKLEQQLAEWNRRHPIWHPSFTYQMKKLMSRHLFYQELYNGSSSMPWELSQTGPPAQEVFQSDCHTVLGVIPC